MQYIVLSIILLIMLTIGIRVRRQMIAGHTYEMMSSDKTNRHLTRIVTAMLITLPVLYM